MTTGPNAVDAYVGARIRMRRLLVGMSQERLGTAIGVTFQQVQKYERGTNRVGPSRLAAIADALEVPIAFFFEGLETGTAVLLTTETEEIITAFLNSRDGLALAAAWVNVKNLDARRRILDLVRALVEIEGGHDP